MPVMLANLLALGAAGALCAGCSAPKTETTLSLDNPANPAAASVPYVRPVNVLAMGERPATASPTLAMRMSTGAVASTPGDRLGKPDATGNRGVERITPGSAGSSQPSQARPEMHHGAMPGMSMPAEPQ